MAFHGYTPEDYQYGRNRADEDLAGISDDATARELAHIAERFKDGYYVGVSTHENMEALRNVASQALAQVAVAQEMGLLNEERDYGVVAARSQEFLDLFTNRKPIRYTSEEQRAAYRTLLQQA